MFARHEDPIPSRNLSPNCDRIIGASFGNPLVQSGENGGRAYRLWGETELVKKSPAIADENKECLWEMYRNGKRGFYRWRCSGSGSTSCCRNEPGNRRRS